MAEDEIVEVRCPVDQVRPDGVCHPGKLFFMLRKSGEQPTYDVGGNLIQLSCPDCRKRLRRQGREVSRVIHAYNILGELVKTWAENDVTQ